MRRSRPNDKQVGLAHSRSPRIDRRQFGGLAALATLGADSCASSRSPGAAELSPFDAGGRDPEQADATVQAPKDAGPSRARPPDSGGAQAPEAGAPRTGPGRDASDVDGALPLTCGELTVSNVEGPFFLSGSTRRQDVRPPQAEGTLLELSGQVKDPQCRPLSGVVLDFWQADPRGDYDADGLAFRGHQLSDAAGRFRLLTLVPGRYLNGAQFRPAHLHVKVRASPSSPLLTTQLYFPGDPYNDVDPFIDPSLIMSVSSSASTETARFDFVIPAQ